MNRLSPPLPGPIVASASGVRDWLRTIAPDAAKGLRAAIATVVPFYLAGALDRPDLNWIAVGGWLGSLADPGGPRPSRAFGMAAFAVAGSAAIALTLSTAGGLWSTTLVLAVAAFCTCMLRVLGNPASTIGTILLILVAIAAGSTRAAPVHDGLLFLAGAFGAVFLSSILWPVWTHLPVRRAVAQVFAKLAAYAESVAACAGEQAATVDDRFGVSAREHQRAIRAAIEEARAVAVASRTRRVGESSTGANLRALLGEGEAEFFRLIALSEEIATVVSQGGGAELARALQALAHAYTEIHDRLFERTLRSSRPGPRSAVGPLPAGHAGLLATSLLASSRAALVVASDLNSARVVDVEGAPPPSLRSKLRSELRDAGRSLRDALVPSSPYLHHAVRVMGTISAAFLIGRSLSLKHVAWVTVTAVAVLQPYPGATIVRAVERVVGTALGSIVVLLLMLTLHQRWALTAVLFPLSVAAVVTRPRSYRLFTFFLTPVFVLTADQWQAGFFTAAARAGDAALGGLIALVAATVVVPSWERRRLGDALAAVVVGLQSYADLMFDVLERGRSSEASARIVAARRALGIGLGEAETSLERMLAEPRRFRRGAEDAMLLLTYTRRLSGALTALDVLLVTDESIGARRYEAQARQLRAYVRAALESARSFIREQPTSAGEEPPVIAAGLPPALADAVARLIRHAGLIAGLSAHAPSVV